MLKFNKTIKTQLINAAMTAKYKPRFEVAMRELSVAARKWAVENSLHNLAIKSPAELLPFIGSSSDIYFQDPNKGVEKVALYLGITGRYIRRVYFDDPVFTSGKSLPSDFPELLAVFAVVDECEATLITLSSVVRSYTNAKSCSKIYHGLKSFILIYPSQVRH